MEPSWIVYSLSPLWTHFDVLQKVLLGMHVEFFKQWSPMSTQRAVHVKRKHCSVGIAMPLSEGYVRNVSVGKFALSRPPKGDLEWER